MSHVVVVGAGFAGLVSAYYAVQAGHHVTVVEAASQAGGAITPAVFDLPEGQLIVDAGAEAYASRSQLVGKLIHELGLDEDLTAPHPGGSWLYLPDVGAVPAPKLGMWGIPGDPTAPEVIQALGPEAAARAAQELTMPMDDWAARYAAGHQVTIGALIADRFGPIVLERLVAPVVAGVHSADPYDVDIERIAPGLLAKAIETGSVATAVAALRQAAPPGAAVKTLTGGMHRLIDALVAYLQPRARLLFDTEVTQIGSSAKRVVLANGDQLSADQVVLAVSAPRVFDILHGFADQSQRPALGAGVGLVLLVVDAALLDDQPRGTGMLVSPAVDTVRAKAVTHVTAKWDWAKQATDVAHRHVLRLSYGRVTDPTDGSAPGYDTPDATLTAMAISDAAVLFGLDPQQLAAGLQATKVVRWRDPMPLTTPENTGRITALTDTLASTDWLHATGAWFAGTGLAAIAQHASTLKF